MRETSGVPYIFGHRVTDKRLFPQIAGIGTVVIPLLGAPKAMTAARCGNAMQRMLVELAVRQVGLPELWLEQLTIELVDGDGTILLETALCRVVREKSGEDGYQHLFIWTYPFAVTALSLGVSVEILLRSPSGQEWSAPVTPLLRAA